MTLDIEQPRILVGNENDRTLLGANVPIGTYFLDDELETLLQWDGEKWQGIAAFNPAGRIADKDDPFANFFAALGRSGEGAASGAAGIAGGGGVSPAPRVAGDPSLTDAQPGTGAIAVGFGARIIGTTSESIPHNVDTEPTWRGTPNTGAFDDAGYIITAGATKRFQIPAGKAGLYRITCQIALDPTGTSQQRGRVTITDPIFATFSEDTQTPAVAQVCTWRATRIARQAVGAVISFTFLQTNSGALAKILTSSAAEIPGRCFAEIEFLGT